MDTATGACDHWARRSGRGRPPCSQAGSLLHSGKHLPRSAPSRIKEDVNVDFHIWHRRPSERKIFGLSCPTQKMLQGIDLEGVASGRQEARTVQLPPCRRGGQQVRDVANVPDVLRALARRQVDVIQRKAASRRPFPTHALKHHAGLARHVQSDGVQLPGPPSSAWRTKPHPHAPVNRRIPHLPPPLCPQPYLSWS